MGWGEVGWRVKTEKGTGWGQGERDGKRERAVGREVLFLFPLFRNVFLVLHFNKCNIFSVYPYQASSYLQAKLY